jgi:hypothetical protein
MVMEEEMVDAAAVMDDLEVMVGLEAMMAVVILVDLVDAEAVTAR